MGQFYLLLGDPTHAVEQLRLALECEIDPRSEHRKHLLTLGSVLAQALEKDGQIALAEQSHTENLKQRAEFYGEDHAGYGFGLAWYAEFLARQSDERAIQVALEAFQSLQRSMHPRMAEVLVLLARLQIWAGLEHPFSTLDLDEDLWDLVGQAMNSGLSDFSFEILLETIDSYLSVDQEFLGPRAPGRRAAHEAGFFIARGSGHLAYMHIHAEILREWSRVDDAPKGELWATLEMAFAAEKMGNMAEAAKCAAGARAMASALLDLLRPELPEGLLDDIVLHEGQLCPRLNRNPTREEEAVLLRAWAQAFSRLNQARF